MLLSTRKSRKAEKKRRGTAMVEFVFCIPVLVFLTLGVLDLCVLIYLKETLTLAAYEGARIGARQGGTDAAVNARVTEFLDERNVTHANTPATFGQTTFDNATTLEHVETTVTVPIQGNLIVSDLWWKTTNISATVTFRKEYAN